MAYASCRVEFGADYRGNEVHMLGYFFDRATAPCSIRWPRCARGASGRPGHARQAGAAGRHRPVGARDRDRGRCGAEPPAPSFRRSSRRAIAGTIDEVFDKYLGHGRPGYVERTQLSPAAASRWCIRRAAWPHWPTPPGSPSLSACSQS